MHHLPARHGLASRRHALSRRLRGARQGGHQGDRAVSGRHHVHRRDPHRHRCGRHQRRRHGRLESPEAGARRRCAALHRLDHLQGIPPAFREGPRPGAAVPEDRRQRALGRGCDQDPEGSEALLRGIPQAPLYGGRHPVRRRAFRPLHERPQAPGQGDRRDRRDGSLPDARRREQAAIADRRQGDRGNRGDDGPHPAQDGFKERRRGAQGPDRQPASVSSSARTRPSRR